VLLALTSAGLLHLWDAWSLAPLGGGPLALGGDFSGGGVLAHPDTYLNKVLVGDGAGRLTLWNIRSRALVHAFRLEGEEPTAEAPGAGAGITALEPSPAIDVVAVGRKDGRIELVNLKFDRLLFRLRQERVPVTSLAFRTDAAAGAQECPMLVSGGQDGQVRHIIDAPRKDLQINCLTHTHTTHQLTLDLRVGPAGAEAALGAPGRA
jgi:WD40 repeat protein